jgi:PIN domain nuclease of toxin-antitoxin system
VKLLVDTRLLLWAAGASARLPTIARALLEDRQNTPTFSAASLREITFKAGLGRPDFRVEPTLLRRGLLDNGWQELPVSSAHAAAVAQLPPLHRDPFDRLLLAQATVEGMLPLTADAALADYPGPIRRV